MTGIHSQLKRADFNSELKHWLLDTRPRCRETLWRSVCDILDQFKPEEYADYLVYSGYAST